MRKWKDDPFYALEKALIESIQSSGLRIPPLTIKEKKSLVDAFQKDQKGKKGKASTVPNYI